MANLAVATFLLSTVVLAGSMKRSSTYITKSGSEDLETSASGYSYQVQSDSPSDYKSFSESEEKLGDFGYPSIHLRRYSEHPFLRNLLHGNPNYLSDYKSDSIEQYKDTPYSYARGFDKFMDDPLPGISSPSHYDAKSTNFIKGGGSNYEEAEKASRGKEGETGYANRDEFAKGLKGQHGSEEKKDFYDILAGNKGAHHEEDGHYASRHQSSKGSKGGSFSSEGSHDKGSKTTGFHNVYHKDEYKKDHSFYDKADKKGHFNRYGNFDSKGSAEADAFAKGGNNEEKFKEGKYGSRGESDKGHFLEEANGYKGAEGRGKIYQKGAAFANRAGKSFGAVGGFSEGKNIGQFADEK
ncbi:uncharacterized protein [Leptinotarsa decemlineata]|uniref:uncharacterized protein n=1 Tax=Leptinotarsa decemlineata TaxID=7539 RepID=UPI003D30C0A5